MIYWCWQRDSFHVTWDAVLTGAIKRSAQLLISYYSCIFEGVSQHLLQLRVSVAPWKHSLTARLPRVHSMMGGVISLQPKENIIIQKTSARGPEKHSGLFIHPAWSKESSTQLCYSSGALLLLFSCSDCRCLAVCFEVFDSHCVSTAVQKPPSLTHVLCVWETLKSAWFSWEKRRRKVTLIVQRAVKPVVTLLFIRKIRWFTQTV